MYFSNKILFSFIAVLAMNTILGSRMPQNNYACHVITDKQNIGINFIQSHNLEEAVATALNVPALVNIEAKTEKATLVVQCVSLPDGKFDDFTAQKLLENIPQ